MSSLAKYLDPEVVQQVARLDLRARFIVEGFVAGLHRSPFQGLSTDFSEHRKYVPGDDLRTLDWNVFARTDRLFVRKYQAETHLDCHILVDASASMGRVGLWGATSDRHPTKLDYAIHLTAALGYLVTRQGDAVGLGVISEGLEHLLPPRSRRADLIQLLTVLTTIRPAGTTGLARGIHLALERIVHRGLVVILSDLLTDQHELMQALHHVRFRGHDLIVMHILDSREVRLPFEGAVRLEDPETHRAVQVDADAVRAAYRQALGRWREQLAAQLAVLKADYVPLDTSMRFDQALIEFLAQRSRRR